MVCLHLELWLLATRLGLSEARYGLLHCLERRAGALQRIRGSNLEFGCLQWVRVGCRVQTTDKWRRATPAGDRVTGRVTAHLSVEINTLVSGKHKNDSEELEAGEK